MNFLKSILTGTVNLFRPKIVHGDLNVSAQLGGELGRPTDVSSIIADNAGEVIIDNNGDIIQKGP